jgi:Ca2+-binding RTX toxin-like protein
MSTQASLAGLALMAAALSPLPAAHAAAVGETCQGQPATIVGGPGRVDGTEGDDVIVVNTTDASLTEVSALGGDDRICINGPLPFDIGPEDIVSFVQGGLGNDSLQVVASQAEDDLEVYGVEAVDIRMRGGNDRLVLAALTSPSVVAGGSGQNSLTVKSASAQLVMDLEDEQMEINDSASTLNGFTKVRAYAANIDLRGSAEDETLQAWGCTTEIRGGKGDDFLTAASLKGSKTCSRGALLLGQKGSDRLRGTTWNDRLIGGPGRDSANGKAGTDRCVAEAKQACER